MSCAKRCAHKIIQLLELAESLIYKVSDRAISNTLSDSLIRILEEIRFAALEMEADPRPDVMERLDATLCDIRGELERSHLTMQAIQRSLDRLEQPAGTRSRFLRGLRIVLLTVWAVAAALYWAPMFLEEYGFWIFSAGLLLTYPAVWFSTKILDWYLPDSDAEHE